MSNAKRDQNRVTIAMGVSNTDGITPLPFKVDPVTGYLLCKIEDTTAKGAVTAVNLSKRDANRVPSGLGVSNADGTTIMALRTTGGYLSIKSD